MGICIPKLQYYYVYKIRFLAMSAKGICKYLKLNKSSLFEKMASLLLHLTKPVNN